MMYDAIVRFIQFVNVLRSYYIHAKIMVGVYYLVKEKYLHSSQAFTKKR